MPLAPPRSLSPSKIAAFSACPLAFRFSVIDRLPEPPTRATLLGNLVHKALELLFLEHPAGRRGPAAATEALAVAWEDPGWQQDLTGLGLPAEEGAALRGEAGELVGRLWAVEDPDALRTVGVELTVEATVEGVRLRGIIDRLDLDRAGRLVVVDYKTGRVPPVRADQARLAGVRLYALLLGEVLGQLPSLIRLVYLRDPLVLEASVEERQVRATRRRTLAIWEAICRACATEDFRPRPSGLCRSCAFAPRCPAQGNPAQGNLSTGDPSAAQPPLAGVWSTPPVAPSSTVTSDTRQP